MTSLLVMGSGIDHGHNEVRRLRRRRLDLDRRQPLPDEARIQAAGGGFSPAPLPALAVQGPIPMQHLARRRRAGKPGNRTGVLVIFMGSIVLAEITGRGHRLTQQLVTRHIALERVERTRPHARSRRTPIGTESACSAS